MSVNRPGCADPAHQLATDRAVETRLRGELAALRARTGATIADLRRLGWSWRQIGSIAPTSTVRDRYDAHIATAGEAA